MAHRGFYNYGGGIQENSVSAMIAALRNGSTIEIDVKLTRNGPIVVHDFGSYRVTNLSGLGQDRLWSACNLEDVVGTPLIIREVEKGKFTEDFTVTGDTIVSLEDFLDIAFDVNPNATIFADTNERQTAEIAAWFSHRPRYLNRIVVMFYSFQYPTGISLAEAIDDANADSNWRSTVRMLPNLYPEQLPILARRHGTANLDYNALVQAGTRWIDELVGEMWVVGLLMLVAVPGRDEKITGILTDPDAITLAGDRAAVDIMTYVRHRYPTIKLGSGTRAYIFRSDLTPDKRTYYTTDLWTGLPQPWSEGDAWDIIRRLRATPGNAPSVINLDFVISDRPFDDIAIAQWRLRGVVCVADFDFPPLNAINTPFN
ncbi:glycerophosphodiester phosphodiesterase family protein [Agrobacterium tumefaciens]|uniref:glycerophosphodiester phosphodiesterase family protein n=1 Tax=Agrobacterium tumefaciens TaxID=358 RepID=UPI002452DD11|nr:glycerophosphodiester phosphodiesterase family protein [Agrobacterium tumefaciens]